MAHTDIDEAYISVDVETAGPCPSQYSLLSIGACSVAHPERTFYVELQPVSEAETASATQVHGLSLEQLRQTGLPPAQALQRFSDWLEENVPAGRQPIFVAFNAPFDWMFVCDYFQRFLKTNPFGHAALDIKAFYMGRKGVTWGETTMHHISARYAEGQPLSHHALDDAQNQAEIFRKILGEG